MIIPEKNLNLLPRELILHGGHNENSNPVNLKAGLLSMIYENGNLRHITMGGHEIIRMIYPAVRNKLWLTIKPEISNLELTVNKESFKINYSCLYDSEDIKFSAFFSIEGHPNNSLVFEFKGEALENFEKNRIGFCILHPVKELAGTDCLIKHSDNEIEIAQFPVLISPDQPFRDISVMHWKISGISCRLDLSGDVFETEDQRNWTDASYKTYSTPLSIPYPVTMQKGDRIEQCVILRAKPDLTTRYICDKEKLIRINPDENFNFPKTGIVRSTRSQPISDAEINILKTLHFDHYRIDLFLFEPGWQVTGNQAISEALKLNYTLELALFFNEDAENQATDFVEWVKDSHAPIALIILYHKDFRSTPDWLTDILGPILKESISGIRLACGTNANFAQINRARPESIHTDLICYSIHPQEHATDNLSLIENIEGQGYTVETARSFCGDKGLWITPVNMKRRFNAGIENYERCANGSCCPSQVENRMMSLFGACWTGGCIKHLYESGIQGATFFETVGERGIFQGDYPSRWPENFQSFKGMIFPLFFVFQFLLRFKSFKIIRSKSAEPLKYDALTLSDGRKFKFILINFTPQDHEIKIDGVSGIFDFKQLNEDTYSEAAVTTDWLIRTPGIQVNLDEKFLLKPFSVSFAEN